jgi:hypothetical protein
MDDFGLFALPFGLGREDDHLIWQNPVFADLFSAHNASFIAKGAQMSLRSFQFQCRLENAFHRFVVTLARWFRNGRLTRSVPG